MPAIPQDLLGEAACYNCFGLNLGTALELALLSRISDHVGGGILSELGDTLNTESGDRLIT